MTTGIHTEFKGISPWCGQCGGLRALDWARTGPMPAFSAAKLAQKHEVGSAPCVYVPLSRPLLSDGDDAAVALAQ